MYWVLLIGKIKMSFIDDHFTGKNARATWGIRLDEIKVILDSLNKRPGRTLLSLLGVYGADTI